MSNEIINKSSFILNMKLTKNLFDSNDRTSISSCNVISEQKDQ